MHLRNDHISTIRLLSACVLCGTFACLIAEGIAALLGIAISHATTPQIVAVFFTVGCAGGGVLWGIIRPMLRVVISLRMTSIWWGITILGMGVLVGLAGYGIERFALSF